jgi:type I restriction enzyme M protein
MLNSETKRHIDAARDVLVGVAPNPMTQIDQITYALIYKFMDDMDKASINAGGEPSFFVSELEPYAWSRVMDSRMGNQEKLNLYGEALQKFSEAKQLPELFRTIFRAAFLPYRSPETLGLFLKEINHFDYSHPEELGNAYEYLLSIMSAQGDAGQFRTPRHIIDFMVDVINPTKNDKVLDPACGTGGFLVSTYKHILEQHDGKDDPNNLEQALTPDERKKLMNNLEGYDIDPSMVRIAQVNMYLHLFKNPKIYQYDSLTSDDRWSDKFDVVLANPPFMSPKGGINPHSKFAIQSSRSEILFVDYIANHLKPSGRAAIIVPEGVIFKNDKSHRVLRKDLIENGLVAVLSLPAGVFKPYSGVKTSILVIDKAAALNRTSILHVQISNDGFSLGDTRRPINLNDLPAAKESLRAWLDAESQVGPLAEAIPKEELLRDPKHLLVRQLSAEEATGEFDFSNLGEIFRVITPPKKIPSSQVLPRGMFPVVDQSVDFIAGYTDNLDAVLFPEQPLLIFGDHTCSLKFVDFPFAQGADGIKILSFPNSVLTKFAYYVLLVKPLESRGYQRHFSLLKNYEFPVPPIEIQERVVAELDGYSAIIDGAMKIVENWKPRIDEDLGWETKKLSELVELNFGERITKKDDSGSLHPVFGGGGESFRTDAANRKDKFVVARFGLSPHCVRFVQGDFWLLDSGGSVSIKPGMESQITEEFAGYLLMGMQTQIYGCSRGGAQRNLNPDEFYELSVKIPNLETQKRIVEEIRLEEAHVKSTKKMAEGFERQREKVLFALLGI